MVVEKAESGLLSAIQRLRKTYTRGDRGMSTRLIVSKRELRAWTDARLL
jgi:hypothetical protein